jgi:hypothetical protein
VFCGTPGGVQGGSVCTHKTSRAGGRHEHPAGGARVWAVAQDHPENDAVFFAAGVCPQEAGGAAETGTMAGHHRSDPGGRSDAAEEAAPHGQANLGPVEGRARVQGEREDAFVLAASH